MLSLWVSVRGQASFFSSEERMAPEAFCGATSVCCVGVAELGGVAKRATEERATEERARIKRIFMPGLYCGREACQCVFL